MEAFIGMITPFAFNFPPSGWMTCQGQVLPISQYQALFALLGVTYGGNGSTTFQLPDLRGRVLVGQGQGLGLSQRDMGEIYGVESVTLTTSNMPMHAHTLPVFNGAGNRNSPAAANLAVAITNDGSPVDAYTSATANASLGTATSTAGSSTPLSALPPTLVVNYCICTSGIFPSRN